MDYSLLWRSCILLASVVLVGCQTAYQPQSFTGGYSEFLTAPDEAVITFRGNGYTAAERVVEMTALRCAEVTLAHGYRYFVGTGVSDLSRQTSFYDQGSRILTGLLRRSATSRRELQQPPSRPHRPLTFTNRPS